jgi:uncharacterized protein (TIGR02588 family)
MKTEKNWLEWTMFAIGLALILGALGYLGHDALTMRDEPPHLVIELGAPAPRRHAFLVPVAVTNHGDATAEDVRIEVVLEAGGVRERGEIDMAFLPRAATRRGWVTFHRDPGAGKLVARVLGYESP